ncbi:MAG TPA: hypothetical protein VEZ15_06520 [Acidimicrobiia bacterium]|nr:hypothetical protein [Acidimicrobiia bacterium]
MLRLTVRLRDDADDVRDCVLRLRAAASPAMRIVAAFAEPKCLEAYFDLGEADPEAIGLLAHGFGFDDYELTVVEPISVVGGGGEPELAVAPLLGHRHPAAIAQVVLEGDGRTLCIRARHRRHETIQEVDVDESDRDVCVRVFVAIPRADPYAGRVSFAVDFSVVRVRLEQPLGERRVVVGGTTFWPGGEALAPDVAHASAEEVLARLERYVAARRAADGAAGVAAAAADRRVVISGRAAAGTPRHAPPAPLCGPRTAPWARADIEVRAQPHVP